MTHGHAVRGSQTSTYVCWSNMIQRCTNPKHPNYRNYGARGITVCERWRVFENFLVDMGSMPVGCCIEREKNDRGYELGNCRWATRKDQARNMRTTTMVEIDGVTLPLAIWCEELGLNRSTVRKRVSRTGCTYVEALHG